MTQVPLAQPPASGGGGPFDQWIFLLWKRVSSAGQILWSYLDFTGSNLTDLETRNHADLQNHNTTDYYHLTQANHTDLTDGGQTSLHKHDHAAQDNLNSTDYYHMTQANHTDLTDGGDSTLHYHASDRARANHTGTQTASTISDFDTEVSNNTDVAANTAARHAAVTVTDSTSIDLTLTGQDITAAAIFGTTPGTVAEGNHNHSGVYQPVDADLTAIAALTLTANQVLGKDAAGTGWEGKTITEGTGISVTHGANSITIAATGSSGGAVSNLVSSPLTIDADTSYVVVGYLTVTDDLTLEGNLGVL
jgi:hypothetical protein